MSQPTAISIQGVTHRYARNAALQSINLDIPSGQMVAFIGPDGVGKSTLLGLIAGSRKIQTGSIQVLGKDMANPRARTALLPRIAYMPQGLGKNLYMDLTVQENLSFFGQLFGQGRVERTQRIRTLLNATGLSQFLKRPVGKLSGGMKQKLGLCCALIHDPDLLILDEPTTGVDPLSRRQFWDLIKEIRAARPQMSVLVATAYMQEAEEFDWIAAMNSGQILASGGIEKIKSQTNSTSLETTFTQLLGGNRTGNDLIIPPYQIKENKPAVIVTRKLTKKFGDFVAVNDVSVEIRPGEIFGFLGSNGCGKTTTMKMLTGLLPASSGEARILGHTPDAKDMMFRHRVGYMSQAFSLYNELSVLQNLKLHAQLFHVPAAQINKRITELLDFFDLKRHQNTLPGSLPLGVRQRLSLAVAVVHRPDILILDEPTSGVDPAARDDFWRLLTNLSRKQNTTIFISTHFMNEGMRCDRITLMHAGNILACDTPQRLVEFTGKENLEQAFIAYMQDAIKSDSQSSGSASMELMPVPETENSPENQRPTASNLVKSLRRIKAYSMREAIELSRDRIRTAFAFLGTFVLMLVFGFGITFDVENLTFAVLDRDQTPESRAYKQSLESSRYFTQLPDLTDYADMDKRMQSGQITLAIEIPPDFGKDLLKQQRPEVAVWVDGAMPFRAETAGGYVQGLHLEYIARLYEDNYGEATSLTPITIASRYRYNQDFKSAVAMVPAVIALMLLFIPAILAALGVVREKELGSITNLYVTPTSRFEFLFGKQLPYLAIAFFNFIVLVFAAYVVFDVPVKGSLIGLTLGALFYVGATTAMGLLFSAFTRTQIAALAITAIMTMLPAVQFSGLMQPVSTLEGTGAMIGSIYPTTFFIHITQGAFAKDLDFSALWPSIQALLISWPLILALSVLLLKKQER